jgi:sodium transport system permease protein
MKSRLWWQLVFIVLRKELIDAFRDRRALYTLLFGAAFGPAMVAFMLNRVADRQRQVEDVRIPIVGIEHAPAFIGWLRQQSGVEVVPLQPAVDDEGGAASASDAEQAVIDRREDVVVVIPDDFANKFRVSRPAVIKLVSDGSRQTARPKVQRVRALIQRYSGEIGSLRLISRGVSPAIVTAVGVEDVEVSSAQQRAAMILNFIPLFIVLAAFTGGMQIATDSTAGERERGSLEPLLVNPAPRWAIVGGKWLAATVAAMMSVLLTTSLCIAMLQFIPLQEFGIRFRLGPPLIAGLLSAVLPMCLLSTGIQTYLSTFARSFKEAQSYMGFLIMLPMLPGLVSIAYPIGNQPWLYPIPILGQHVLLTDVLGGRLPSVLAFVGSAVASLVVAGILIRLTTELFKREKIIFGK